MGYEAQVLLMTLIALVAVVFILSVTAIKLARVETDKDLRNSPLSDTDVEKVIEVIKNESDRLADVIRESRSFSDRPWTYVRTKEEPDKVRDRDEKRG